MTQDPPPSPPSSEPPLPDETLPTSLPVAPRTDTRLLALLLALTVGGFSLGWLHQERQKEQLRQFEAQQLRVAEANKAQFEALETAVRDLGAGIEQQGALVQRVIGTVVPIKLPEGTEQALARIEAALVQHDALIASPEDTASLVTALAALVEGLPVWVQSELFPRILPARWQLDALGLLQRTTPEKDLDALQDLIDALAEHALNRPQGVPDALGARLLERAEELARAAEQASEEQAAEEAKEAVRQRLATQVASLEQDASLFERLADPELQARLASVIHTATLDLRIAAQAHPLDDAALAQRVEALATAAAERVERVRADAARAQQTASRNYQLWALEQINSIPKRNVIEETKLAQIDSQFGRHNRFGAERQDAIERAEDELVRALIERLAVIDTRLLDDAVSEWHRRVFSDRFGSLDETRQAEVVQGFANAIKRTPEDLP